MASRPKLIVIVGPTSSGKSDLAVRLAKKYDGEVISADSRQVYRGMDIGTGKISKKEMRGVAHHLLDIVSPKTNFSVARYKQLAEKTVKDIVRRGKLPIIAGGTGFYIDALLSNQLLPQVKADPKLRALLDKKTAPELFKELKTLDPLRARTIDRHNKRRLIRALEIIKKTGKPVTSMQKAYSNVLKNIGIRPEDVLKIGIYPGPEVLREKIHARLLARVRRGMIAEVEKLHAQGVSWKRLDDLGLEYRYVSRYLRGLLNKEEMLKQLENEIWHYARRQMTWWRKDKDIKWVKSAEI